MKQKRGKDFLRLEKRLYSEGLANVAGVDEAGRGCLAGPVFAAAVIFLPNVNIPDIDDSKKLTAATRERLYSEIIDQAVAWSVASVSHDEIDEINIHHASLKAMKKAVQSLKTSPDYLLVDGRYPVPLRLPQQTLVKGDSRIQVIAAASILAKVSRDRWMSEIARTYPDFGFEIHKGYGTPEHRQAIQKHGLSPIHRRTFSTGLG